MVKPPLTYINYPKLVDHAMRDIAKKLLKEVENAGLKGEHYFLISFITSADGVKLSSKLKQKYAEEMTIVIQHQYEDLNVSDTEFAITLSFDGNKETIVIPFDAFTSFVDPSTRFALQFNPDLIDKKSEPEISKTTSARKKSIPNKEKEDGKVLVLDNFRKK